MVDAEDLASREVGLQRAVEFPGACEVLAERLFDDESAPRSVMQAGQAGGGEVLRAGAEVLGRGREVEEIIFPDLRAFRQAPAFRKPLVGLRIVEFALEIINAGGELFPDFLIDRLRVGELPQRFPQVPPEFPVAFWAAREPDDGEAFRQQAVFGQVDKRPG